MNRLPAAKRAQIINLLIDGNSLKTTSRIADVSINTVTKLLADVGQGCQEFHDSMMFHVSPRGVKCDEIWSFASAKEYNRHQEKRENGDKIGGYIWTWTARDLDSKLIISWLVGQRSLEFAYVFVKDLETHLNRISCPQPLPLSISLHIL